MAHSFPGTAKGLLFAPRNTFPQLRPESMESAFTYFLKVLGIFILLTAIFRATLLVGIFAFLPSLGLLLFAAIGIVAEAILFLIGGTIWAVVTGVWIHLWVYLFGGRRGIGETIRVAFYSFTPVGLLGWIPPLLAGTAMLGGLSLLGPGGVGQVMGFGLILVIGLEILFIGWGFLIAVCGVADFQGMPENRAANAVLVAFLIPLALAIAGIFLLLPISSSLGGLPVTGGY